MKDISYTDALVIGSFQAAAIFPAISRSGFTIAAGLIRKLDRETAAYFSFLVSTPAIAGAIVLQSFDLVSGDGEVISIGSLLIAIISSAVFGYIAIKWLIGFLKKNSLKMFAAFLTFSTGFSTCMWWINVLKTQKLVYIKPKRCFYEKRTKNYKLAVDDIDGK